MKKVNRHRKPISMIVAVVFTIMVCFWANRTQAAPSAPPADKDSGATLQNSESEGTGFIEQEATEPSAKKEKKFPWLLAGAAVVIGAVAIYFLVIKKPKTTLTVTLGGGITGTPAATKRYKKGESVSYSYSVRAGYGNLQVRLDGAPAAASGSVTMDKDHSLDVTATQQFTLTVDLGAGTTGTPAATASYNKDQIVDYSYSLKAGYSALQVKLDGAPVAASGSVTMNGNRTLKTTATLDLGIQWIQIPAGSFQMGDNFGDGYPPELPVHTVYLSTYFISKHEVTFDQFDAFCEATGRSKPDDWGWGRGTLPVFNITWYDAKAFCDWLSQITGKNIHLPTEAQWEKAARGTDQRKYPWGTTPAPACSLGNFDNCKGKNQPVGSYPSGASPYGVLDMAGNVYDWCQDYHSATYYQECADQGTVSNPQGPASGSYRVIRGGCFLDAAIDVRSTVRPWGGDPGRNDGLSGFRVARDD